MMTLEVFEYKAQSCTYTSGQGSYLSLMVLVDDAVLYKIGSWSPQISLQ